MTTTTMKMIATIQQQTQYYHFPKQQPLPKRLEPHNYRHRRRQKETASMPLMRLLKMMLIMIFLGGIAVFFERSNTNISAVLAFAPPGVSVSSSSSSDLGCPSSSSNCKTTVTVLYYDREQDDDGGGESASAPADRRQDTSSSSRKDGNGKSTAAANDQRSTSGYTSPVTVTKHSSSSSSSSISGGSTKSPAMDLHHLETDNLQQNIESWWRQKEQRDCEHQQRDAISKKTIRLESRPVWLNNMDQNDYFTNILTTLSPSKILQDGLDQLLSTKSYPLFKTEWSRTKFDFDYRELLLKTLPTNDIVELSKTGRTEDTFHPLCVRVVLQAGSSEDHGPEWEIQPGIQFVVPIIGNVQLVELNCPFIEDTSQSFHLENPLMRLPEHDMMAMVQDNRKNRKDIGKGIIREASEIEEDENTLLNQISKDLAQRVVEYNQLNDDDADAAADDTSSGLEDKDNDIIKSITHFGQGSCFTRPTGTVSQRYWCYHHETDSSISCSSSRESKIGETTHSNEVRISCIVSLVLSTGLHVPLDLS